MIYYVGSVPFDSSGLLHWGIKGQKWGIRRFRNPDGSLTDAGKARYAQSTGKKNVLDFTDKELKTAVERLRNEQAWRQLVSELDKKPTAGSKGKEAVKKVMSTLGNKALLPFISSAATQAGKSVIKLMEEETSAQNAEKREKEKREREAAEEKKRKKAMEELKWDEDRYDY